MGNKKVLVIDDSRLTIALIKKALSKSSYTVVGATSGEEGITEAKKEKPDLIILDVVMPGINGFETCRKLKQDPDTKSVPVLLLTVKDTLGDIQEGVLSMADYYMTKPFKEDMLMKHIERIISESEEKNRKGGEK